MSEELLNLALRRGLFYPSAEIYANAPSGFWEYSLAGESIRRKVIEFWRKHLVQKEGFLEIFGCSILPEQVFIASGHLKSFADPIVQCRKCSSLHRADELIAGKTKGIVPESLSTQELDALIEKHEVECPKCKSKNFEKIRKFNMMMGLQVGATGKNPAYLRPETCQNIFLDFGRLQKLSRQQLPLGIAQAGSVYRNEIAPRNTLLRTREFSQIEIEVFFNPKNPTHPRFSEVGDYELNFLLLKDSAIKKISCKEAVKKKIVSSELAAYLLARLQQLYEKIGFKQTRLRELGENEKAFYAKEAFDLEVLTESGWIELVACNNRSDYDLSGHSKESKKDLSISEGSEKFIPHVFELSAGVDRAVYALLENSYRKEKRGPEERAYLDLHSALAPYACAVFPLVSKDGLEEKARAVFLQLQEAGFEALFDEKGSIGKRYARVDEIGVIYAITVDYDSMKGNTVTLRERNSMKQKRIGIEELPETLWKLLAGREKF